MASLHMRRFARGVLDKGYKEEDCVEVPKPVLSEGNARISNIKMGSDAEQFANEYTDNFGWKIGEKVEGADHTKLQRAHFSLGNDRLDYEKTSRMDDPTKMGGTRAQLDKQTLKDLQTCHFNLGNDATNYESDQAAGYKLKDYEAYKQYEKEKEMVKSKGPQRSNVYMGSMAKDPGQFETTSTNDFHGRHPITSQQLNADLLEDLRATHFKLGDVRPDYATTTSDLKTAEGYLKEGGKVVRQEGRDLQRTHFMLGADALSYASEYDGNTGAVGDKRENFRLGPKGAGGADAAGGTKGGAGKNTKEANQKSSVMFGNVRTEYGTACDTAYEKTWGKDPAAVARAARPDDTGTKKALQASHFEFGHDATDYQRTNALTDPRKRPGGFEAAALDEKAMEELRKSHFKVGDDAPDYGTTQVDANLAATGDLKAYVKEEQVHKAATSHITLQSRVDPIPSSTVQDTFTFNGFGEGVAAFDCKALHQSHLSLGTAATDYTTTHGMPDTRDKLEETARSVRQLAADGVDLRKTNYELGNERLDYRSQYKEAHVPYKYVREGEKKSAAE